LSLINEALGKNNITDDVRAIRGTQHYRAAYLLMVFNTAKLINVLNDRQVKVLSKKWRSKHVDLVAYLATAHNAPGAAWGAAQRWLDGGAKHSYTTSCHARWREYGVKTVNNHNQLVAVAPRKAAAKKIAKGGKKKKIRRR
jgi:hypothetical protein